MSHTTIKKKYIFGVIFLGLIILLTQVSTAWAQPGAGIIRVDSVSGIDSPTCGSTTVPCKTIQHAVDIANSGNTIRLAAGAYTSSNLAVLVVDSETNSPKSIVIEGGYSPGNWNNYDHTNNVTIIDGQNGRRGLYFDARDKGGSVTLKGVTLQNGLATSSSKDEAHGGGLDCVNSGTVSLIDVLFSNNTVRGNAGIIKPATGGGAAFYKCTVTLQNVTFDSNQAIGGDASPRGAQARGGGFFATSSTVNGQNVSAINNRALAGSSSGSGISADGEVAQSFGGGFDIGSGSVANISDIEVRNNLSRAGNAATYGGFGSGGGVFIEAATGLPTNVTLTRGIINYNQAIGGNGNGAKNGYGGGTGGGVMFSRADVTLNHLEIIGNEAKGGLAANASGGALYFQADGSFTGNNLIVAKNKTTPGSGAVSTGVAIEIGTIAARTLTFNYTTFADNQATDPNRLAGNLISIFGSPGVNVVINDSIIANHTQKPVIAFLDKEDKGHIVTTDRTLWFNNVDPKSSGPGTINNVSSISVGDPIFANAVGDNYHLTGSSAARDTTTSATVSVDIDSQSRPFGSQSDVGADEYYPALDSSFKQVSPSSILAADGPNHIIDYTIKLVNDGPGNVSATLSDPIPTSSAYVNVSLNSGPTCSSGLCTSNGSENSWSGTINSAETVTVTYQLLFQVPIDYTDSVAVFNTATLNYSDSGSNETAAIKAVVFINGNSIFLPTISK